MAGHSSRRLSANGADIDHMAVDDEVLEPVAVSAGGAEDVNPLRLQPRELNPGDSA